MPHGLQLPESCAGAPPEAVARAERAGPGGVPRAKVTLRHWICSLPAAGKAREVVLLAGVAGLGYWRRAGRERRGRAGLAGPCRAQTRLCAPRGGPCSQRSPLSCSSRAASGPGAARRVRRRVSIG